MRTSVFQLEKGDSCLRNKKEDGTGMTKNQDSGYVLKTPKTQKLTLVRAHSILKEFKELFNMHMTPWF